jgi:hypothetical protein
MDWLNAPKNNKMEGIITIDWPNAPKQTNIVRYYYYRLTKFSSTNKYCKVLLL